MPEPDFYIRQDDIASPITAVLRDENGAAINIASATVKFHMAPISGSGTGILNATATNAQNGDGSDGTKGNVSYTWAAGNTALAGLYLGEWEITYQNGAVQTFPNAAYVLIRITDAIA